MPRAHGGRTILAYHLVGAGTDLVIDLPLEEFRRHLEILREGCRVLPLRDVLSLPAKAQEAAEKPEVVLTFDDAYENFYTVVWPLLLEARLPATLFAPVAFLEGASPSPTGNSLRPVSWAQLEEMQGSGLLEVGSHSWSHPDMRALDDSRLRLEAENSRTRLEERLGVGVSSFCYPKALWSKRAEAVLSQAYRMAVIGGGGKVFPDSHPMRLNRVPLKRSCPFTLAQILDSSLWLEEWVAALARRIRR